MSEDSTQGEPQARKPPAMPADMKAFNEKLIADFRANHGQWTGQMAGRSLLILTTTGARTGNERAAVLGYGRAGDRLVVIASDNGAPSAPDWYHNLLARPMATVEVGPEPFKVRARMATETLPSFTVASARAFVQLDTGCCAGVGTNARDDEQVGHRDEDETPVQICGR
jgi:deazaflavin-dependent oxidoreductase (nitroreductase family)